MSRETPSLALGIRATTFWLCPGHEKLFFDHEVWHSCSSDFGQLSSSRDRRLRICGSTETQKNHCRKKEHNHIVSRKQQLCYTFGTWCCYLQDSSSQINTLYGKGRIFSTCAWWLLVTKPLIKNRAYFAASRTHRSHLCEFRSQAYFILLSRANLLEQHEEDELHLKEEQSVHTKTTRVISNTLEQINSSLTILCNVFGYIAMSTRLLPPRCLDSTILKYLHATNTMRCGHCQNPAIFPYKICRDAPEFEDDPPVAWYCCDRCATIDLVWHKTDCSRIVVRRKVFRIMDTAQRLFYVYQEVIWMRLDIRRIERKFEMPTKKIFLWLKVSEKILHRAIGAKKWLGLISILMVDTSDQRECGLARRLHRISLNVFHSGGKEVCIGLSGMPWSRHMGSRVSGMLTWWYITDSVQF